MEKIKIIQDTKGKTLTIWLDDPNKEFICEETSDEIILMKDKDNRVIGIEILHYTNTSVSQSLIVETILRAA